MVERIITALLLVVSIIHLLPLSGLLGVDRLAALYGVTITDTNLEILMRHRAVLFGILGCFFAYAAFNRAIQPVAFAAAFVSLVSFIFLSLSIVDFNKSLYKVVTVDIVALACLSVAVILFMINKPAG